MKTETLLIHGGGDNALGAVQTPIFLTSAFRDAEKNGYSYTRCSNPTREALEKTVALAEGGKYGFAFSSGLAAEDAVFSLRKNIICGKFVYGGTKRLLSTYENAVFADMTDLDEVSALAKGKEPLIFAETPSNPLLRVCDIEALARIAHENGGILAVDNTFLTPIFQNPLLHGADVVVHSATKYLCGHHDSIAGVAVTNDADIAKRLHFESYTKGTCLSPFDSYLVKRGMETLALRMKKHAENAAKVLDFLRSSPEVTDVVYAYDPLSPSFGITKKQSSGGGGMITFTLNGNTEKFVKKLKLIAFAESLGGNASLMTHPYSQTHASLSETEKQKAGITPNLLRLSVGTEDAEDMIDDLEQAMRKK